ncbi:hypothetical protein PRVXT_002935 [Proteinivorax tanatarense]|uniref:Uncharacterized protein n=1 Tax=Proteinivorax tanatarense TaxID=1260629 RepID=A0AAU7VLD0_9FIRM
MVFIPIIVVFAIIIFNDDKKKKYVILKLRNKKRGIKMAHKLMEKYIGHKCLIYTIDNHIEGTIKSLEGNWLEVECGKKKKIEIVNIEFVEKIDVL